MSRELRLPIETERLRLRRLVGGDLAALYALHSREDVTSWLFWGPREQGEVRVSLDGHIARPLDEGVVLAIDLGGELIGTVNVAVGEGRQGEIGFMVPRLPGPGLRDRGGEGDRRTRVHRVRSAPRLRLRRAEQHSVGPCARAARMRKEAQLIENAWVKGKWSSEAVYAILAREWRAAREGRSSGR